MSCPTTALLLFVLVVRSASAALSVNKLSFYRPYPSRTIHYQFDATVPAATQTLFTGAMMKITLDMTTDAGVACLNFETYDATRHSNEPYLHLRLSSAGATQPCFIDIGATTNGVARQLLDLTIDPLSGCTQNERAAMGILANAIGLPDELSRPDRDAYVTVSTAALVNVNARSNDVISVLGKYTTDQVNVLKADELDFKSITVRPTDRYARAGQQAFTLLPAYAGQLGDLAALSLWDCRTLSLMYGCDANACKDAYLPVPPPVPLVQP